MRNKTYRILAKDVKMSNDTWKTGLNNNDMIIGTSGTGKTRGYVIPNILNCDNESIIVADTKGSLYNMLAKSMKKKGYKIINIDFTDCLQSDGYNPLSFIRYDKETDKFNEQDILTVSQCLVPIESERDPFWDIAARQYLAAIIAYVLDCLPFHEHTLCFVQKLLCEMSSGRFDILMKEMSEMYPNSFAVTQYNLFKNNQKAEKMHASIIGVLGEKLVSMSFDGARQMFNNPKQIDFQDLRKEKTIVFLNISDTDRSLDTLVSLFYTQALHILCAKEPPAKSKEPFYPIWFILDDFAANMKIADFDKIISIVRSREIYISVILQSITQLESLYGLSKAKTIINNFDNMLYIGGNDVDTSKYIGFKANKSATSVLSLPIDEAWLFTRGTQPRLVEKYQLE